jgi:MoaA/NifB/PqqE/SkfB family radical SAM enzyme
LGVKTANNLPRLPFEGNIDLTYRCNNDCRHCWLRIAPNAKEKDDELSFGEIKRIVDESRGLGRNVSSEMRHFHQEFSVAPNRFFERGD